LRLILPFVFRGSPREQFKADLIFEGKRSDRILFLITVVAFPAPVATWDRNVSDNSVIQINDFTFNVSAYVDITAENRYGNYSVTIDNGSDKNLILKFEIRTVGSVNDLFLKHIYLNIFI